MKFKACVSLLFKFICGVVIEKFASHLRMSFKPERYGASIIKRDEETIILSGYEHINEECIYQLKSKWPRVNISFHSSEQSKTGYIVVFQMQMAKNVIFTSYCFQGVSCILYLAFSIYHLCNVLVCNAETSGHL